MYRPILVRHIRHPHDMPLLFSVLQYILTCCGHRDDRVVY